MLSTLFDIDNVLFTVLEYQVSLVELWSTALGLWCVIAFRKESIWAYPIGILNSIGFMAIFYQVQLYSDFLLNFYFIGISILGWYWWARPSAELEVRYMSTVAHAKWLAGIILCTLILGMNIDLIFNAMAQIVASVIGAEYVHTPAATPFWDAATTVMSIAAMYLLARKYVEAWVLWVIVDVVCVGLYLYRGVLFLSLEYLIFLGNAVLALYQWHKLSKEASC